MKVLDDGAPAVVDAAGLLAAPSASANAIMSGKPMLVENLHKQWHTQGAGARRFAKMTFEAEALKLGASTILASVERGAADVDDTSPFFREARLLALLSAAYRRPIDQRTLTHVRRAIVRKAESEETLALIHLALTGLGELAHPVEDSRRLFMADGLIRAGVSPRDILLVLGLPTDLVDAQLAKYSQDQPRVPKGSGRTSGQWVGNNSGQRDPPHPPPAPAPRPAPEQSASGLPIVDVAYPGDFHDIVRDHFAEVLRKAGNTVLTEVNLMLLDDPPVFSRIDILFRTAEGVISGIDVKTGADSRFTLNQQIVYPHVEVGGLVISADPRISTLALTPGVPLPPIEIFELYAEEPGARMVVTPYKRYKKEN